MLLLTRKLGEWVDIKDTRTDEVVASVYVTELHSGTVRLGFRGPPHIQFLRHNAHKRDKQPREKDHGETSEAVGDEATRAAAADHD